MANGYAYNPTLETVLMIEETAKEHSGEVGKYQLWKKLPKKVMYQTYQVALDYLLESNKIAIDKQGKISWIWNPELVQKYLQRPDLRIR